MAKNLFIVSIFKLIINVIIKCPILMSSTSLYWCGFWLRNVLSYVLSFLNILCIFKYSFKKNRNSKTFHYWECFRQSLLSFRICFALRPGFVVNRFRFGNRLCSFRCQNLQTLICKIHCCKGILDLFGLEKKDGFGYFCKLLIFIFITQNIGPIKFLSQC